MIKLFGVEELVFTSSTSSTYAFSADFAYEDKF